MHRIVHTLLAVAVLWGAAATCVAQEAELLGVLKSNADLKEKADACRMLSQVGTAKAVPVLAGLLGDEKLSHMARYALEPIPSPAVDDALRDALGKLKGPTLVGVIGSVGVRRDAKAIPVLAKLLGDADPETAQAAARALGKIGTAEAAKAIEEALPATAAGNKVAFCEGLFRCAEALAKDGQAKESLAIYDRLRVLPQAPQQVRGGAIRGAILGRGKDGIALLVEAIGSDDYVLTAAAARTAIEMPGPEVTAALARELAKLPAEKQILFIETLGYRGDKTAGAALLPLAAKGPTAVRLAAVNNLTHLGYAPALPLLAELALGEDRDLAVPARACLANFPGKEADATIQAMLSHQDAKIRALAVEMLDVRNAAGSAVTLLKACRDPEEAVRLAALRALRDQAGVKELPSLLDVIVAARSAAELQAAENVLAALCTRLSEPVRGDVKIVKAEYGDLSEGPSADVTAKVAEMVKNGALAIEANNDNFGDPANGKVKQLRVEYAVNGATAVKVAGEGESLTLTATGVPPAIVDALCGASAKAQGDAKCSLLRVLRSAGGPKALEVVLAASKDQEPKVKDTALRVLCDWPTADALPLVSELARSSPNKTIKVLAVRGFVRLVPQQNVPDAKKIELLKEGLALAERSDEKRAVLSALGNVATADALALVAPFLDDPSLKEEACLAAVSIAEKLKSGPEVAAAMTKVVKLTGNKKTAARANAILKKK